MCVCVCVCQRERERESESVCSQSVRGLAKRGGVGWRRDLAFSKVCRVGGLTDQGCG